MNSPLLDEALQQMQAAHREVHDLRSKHAAAMDRFNKAKERWRKLDEARVLGFAELEAARQRALAAGNTELAALLVPR
jgi:hypothetical protein